MELVGCINSISGLKPGQDYVETVRLRLGSISQVIEIKEEPNHLACSSIIDKNRIRQTADFYHIATSIYFHHHVQHLASKHPVIKALVQSALLLISKLGICTSPWPLFVVACEVTEDSERVQILEAFERMESHRRIGNISVTRVIVETLWKQQDLSDDDLVRTNLDWKAIMDLETMIPSFI